MTPPLRELLKQATDDLRWINTIPHALDHLIGVDKERRAREAEANAAPAEGRAHADPTAGIALGSGGSRAISDVEESETVPQVDHALETVWIASRTLAANVARWYSEPHDPRPLVTLRGLRINQAEVNIAYASPKVDGLDWLSGEEQAGLVWLVREDIAGMAEWLRRWGEGVYRAAPKIAAIPVEQRRRLNCQRHAEFGFDVNVTGSRSHCDRCLAFKREFGVWPDERICRLSYEHPRRSPSTGMVAEARAAGKARKHAG